MKRLVMIITFSLLLAASSSVNVSAEDYGYLTPLESAEVICNRLDEINEYAIDKTGKGNINSCKFYEIEINEVGNVFKGVYIDFNGHNSTATYYDFNGVNGGTILGSFVVEK
jgi:hypothetical protein